MRYLKYGCSFLLACTNLSYKKSLPFGTFLGYPHQQLFSQFSTSLFSILFFNSFFNLFFNSFTLNFQRLRPLIVSTVTKLIYHSATTSNLLLLQRFRKNRFSFKCYSLPFPIINR